VLVSYTDKWILHVYGILLAGLRLQRTMPLQAAIRHRGTVSIPATGHDLDPLILADPSSCWTYRRSRQKLQERAVFLYGWQAVMCLLLCGAQVPHHPPHNSEQDDRVVACAITCSTDAVCATDRDDAKRQFCSPRAFEHGSSGV
jgi:hypothetical protein